MTGALMLDGKGLATILLALLGVAATARGPAEPWPQGDRLRGAYHAPADFGSSFARVIPASRLMWSTLDPNKLPATRTLTFVAGDGEIARIDLTDGTITFPGQLPRDEAMRETWRALARMAPSILKAAHEEACWRELLGDFSPPGSPPSTFPRFRNFSGRP